MKDLYLIGGTMGVGKTTTCRQLQQKLPACVFLDGDWCWDMQPFIVNEETKEMVVQNIAFLLNQFLHCSAFENVVFCWVMHQQSIWDDILSRLDTSDAKVRCISLICNEEALTARLQKDIDAGLRQPDIIPRSVARIPLYNRLSTEKLDVSALTAEEAAEKIIHL